ncbi:MAG TPA: arginase family protein, partial [Longimicrobiales bacterium]|nr:arginase family protein [Longimicrobiales bacterium]
HEMRREGWIERALSALGERVYVTVDVDFFDPSLVPATGTPEPGGGDWWQANDLLAAVFRERNVVGVDVVELAPREGGASSGVVAAKLVYRMIGYHAARRGG